MNDEQTVWERADLRYERTLGGDMSSLRAAMVRIRSGCKCEDCGWQRASVVSSRRRLLCRTCANVDSAIRSVEAIALRLKRR